MDVRYIARDFVALCKAGKFDEAGEKYWADTVVSVEPTGEADAVHGRATVRAKGEQWSAAHDVHGMEVSGPYVNGNQFVVGFAIDVTAKADGQRISMDEVGLYTLKDGKIVEERFFYG
ncbi:MAG: nuclear transport factor 2 family protein [Parvibaculum sp.]|nr:nuclear transport factor 2 family protein [Parvibaculum sp.]